MFGDAALAQPTVGIAQNTEKYLDLGSDNSGDPFLLDTTTMGKVEPGFGSVLFVYQIKNGSMNEILIKSSCLENRLWVLGVRSFDQNGIEVAENKEPMEVKIGSASPARRSMQYYCHVIGATGW